MNEKMILIKKNTSMKVILEKEIDFSKAEIYAGLTPLHHDQARKILNFLKGKENAECEIPRDVLRDLYDAEIFNVLLKAFGKKKCLFKFEIETFILLILNNQNYQKFYN